MEAFVRGGVRTVRLVLDAGDAIFPLTIDPLTTSPVWTFEVDQTSANLGHSVATAGDIDGDGYSDIAVGAPFYDNPETNEGAVFFFRGSPSGPVAAGVFEGAQAGALTGQSVAAAGDVNGDGYGDVIVGLPGYDNFENAEPEFRFGDLHLDVGTYLARFLQPVISGINDVIAPFKPIIDVINAPIPVVSDLAAMVGRETQPFKTDVRKLKALGLTESLEVGYRLSPRGKALLPHLAGP